MTKITEIESFNFPSGYKAKKLEQKKWIYLWDWFLAFLMAIAAFTIGLIWSISTPAKADFSDNIIICENLDEFSNGADYRDFCVTNVL